MQPSRDYRYISNLKRIFNDKAFKLSVFRKANNYKEKVKRIFNNAMKPIYRYIIYSVIFILLSCGVWKLYTYYECFSYGGIGFALGILAAIFAGIVGQNLYRELHPEDGAKMRKTVVVRRWLLYGWFIIISFISVVSLCRTFHSNTPLSFDYLGLLVGILAILVTLLIGWNIYRVLDEDRISKIEISMQEKFREAMVHVHYNSYIAFKAQNSVEGSITSLVQTLDFLFQNVDEEYENIERNCRYLEEELERIPNSFGETNCKILRKSLSKIEKSEAFKTGLDKETKQKLETAFNTIRQRIKS